MNSSAYLSFLALFVHIVSGTLAPASRTVLEGDTAEFHCEVDDHGTLNDIDWVFTWSDNNVRLYIEAETTGIVGPSTSAFLKKDHGIYRTFYERITTEFGRIHNCTLRIEHVKKGDEGRYNCAYYRQGAGGLYYEHITTTSAQLLVQVPPGPESPSCSFVTTPHRHHTNATMDTFREDVSVKLICESSGGDPPAMLRWYTNDLAIGSDKESRNSRKYQLTAEDNGRSFICKATSPALQYPRNCSVTPYQIPLKVHMEDDTPGDGMLHVGESVRYVCKGSGLPRINRYSWFINDVDIAGADLRYSVESITNGSVLTIYDVRMTHNSSRIACQIHNPHGLSATIYAGIIIHPAETRDISALPIIIGMIAGSFCIILIVTLGVFLYKYKDKPVDMHLNGSLKPLTNQYQNVGKSTVPDEVTYVVAANTHRDPMYINQRSPTTVDERENLLTISYEVVHPVSNHSKQGIPRIQQNVEGLDYADLQLVSPVDKTAILNPEADDAVTYSQVQSTAY